MFNASAINIKSYGGPLFDFTGNFDNGLIFISEGGKHENNPFGGIQIGIDNEGVPNLVEEGEVIFNEGDVMNGVYCINDSLFVKYAVNQFVFLHGFCMFNSQLFGNILQFRQFLVV